MVWISRSKWCTSISTKSISISKYSKNLNTDGRSRIIGIENTYVKTGNLENIDKSKTVGGSVGISTTGISSIGINYSDRKQEGITKNTVIIGKESI